jgi:hypothetical protein
MSCDAVISKWDVSNIVEDSMGIYILGTLDSNVEITESVFHNINYDIYTLFQFSDSGQLFIFDKCILRDMKFKVGKTIIILGSSQLKIIDCAFINIRAVLNDLIFVYIANQVDITRTLFRSCEQSSNGFILSCGSLSQCRLNSVTVENCFGMFGGTVAAVWNSSLLTVRNKFKLKFKANIKKTITIEVLNF